MLETWNSLIREKNGKKIPVQRLLMTKYRKRLKIEIKIIKDDKRKYLNFKVVKCHKIVV